MRKRKQPSPSAKKSIGLSLLLFLFITGCSLWAVDQRIEPVIMRIAETKAREIASQAINDAVSEQMVKTMDIHDMIIVHETNGQPAYSFNPEMYNQLESEASARIQEHLNEVATSQNMPGMAYDLPLGMTTGNTLLASIGPRVPITFETFGNVATTISTDLRTSGINNTYLEIFLDVDVKMTVIAPSLSKSIEIDNSIKIGDLFLTGEVPHYFLNGKDSPSLPHEPSN